MDTKVAWLVVIVLIVLVGLLAASLVRLRLELWVSRRVIAALEQAEPKTARAAKATWPALMLWIGLGLLFAQLAVIFRLF